MCVCIYIYNLKTLAYMTSRIFLPKISRLCMFGRGPLLRFVFMNIIAMVICSVYRKPYSNDGFSNHYYWVDDANPQKETSVEFRLRTCFRMLLFQTQYIFGLR